jgi:hypothetical protein
MTRNSLADIGRRVVVATHRRSGTHLCIDLLRAQFPACCARKRWGEPFDVLYLTLEGLVNPARHVSHAQAEARLRRAQRPLVKTHGLPGFAAWGPSHAPFIEDLLSDADVICVVRDGRDVLRSLHRYMQVFDRRARCSLSEFLRQRDGEQSRVRAWAEHVLAWRAEPAVQLLHYEAICSDPRAALTRLGEMLGMTPGFVAPLLPQPLRSRIESHRLRLFSRSPRATNVIGRRAGAGVRWREAFSAEDRAFFQAEAGEALVALGYEADDAWVHAPHAPTDAMPQRA